MVIHSPDIFSYLYHCISIIFFSLDKSTVTTSEISSSNPLDSQKNMKMKKGIHKHNKNVFTLAKLVFTIKSILDNIYCS